MFIETPTLTVKVVWPHAADLRPDEELRVDGLTWLAAERNKTPKLFVDVRKNTSPQWNPPEPYLVVHVVVVVVVVVVAAAVVPLVVAEAAAVVAVAEAAAGVAVVHM
ncbi:hypothetical protein ElyMa_004255900 [Elysia marginata]|uniref:Uncharacterized protein n=1 Tax=Elysia marginata TaxID=1093978 RepID=A0AAV4GTB3_9GAST|nr:hypothetical protein ElyMa_004255900 [Elysia marginata]